MGVSVSAEIETLSERTTSKTTKITDQKKQQVRNYQKNLPDVLKDEDEFWFSRNMQDVASLQEIPPTSSPTTLPPSASPSTTPTGCSYLIDECPSKCWEVEVDKRPPTCTSIAAAFPFLQGCNSLPFDYIDCPECCPDECIDENRDREGCDPTPVPSPAPSPVPSVAPTMRPTGCNYLIEECPLRCWEVGEGARPPTCSSIAASFPFLRGCNSLPFDYIECPECCPDECIDENRDRKGCDPTALPSPAPSPAPSAVPTPVPSATPTAFPSSVPSPNPSPGPSPGPSPAPSEAPSVMKSATPTSIPSSGPSPVPSSAPSAGPSVMKSATPTSIPSSGPSPVPSSAPSAGPSIMKSATPTSIPSSRLSPVPSSAPSAGPSVIKSGTPTSAPSSAPSSNPSSGPSPVPSMLPSKCSEVIESCPHDSCFLSHGDPTRPPDCTDPSIDRPECDAVPPPEGIACPVCCASECRSDHPMFSLSPDGTAPECSPTAVPSPAPSAAPTSAPTPCIEMLENCPADCLSSDVDTRPSSCGLLQRDDCDRIPFQDGCPLCCPAICLDFDPDNCGAPTPVPSPLPSSAPTVMPSPLPTSIPSSSPTSAPSSVPSSAPSPVPSTDPSLTPSEEPTAAAVILLETQKPSSKPSARPTDLPSPLPSPSPSSMPTECTYLIDKCPALCFETDPMKRHPRCIDFNRPDCDVLPYDEANCPQCCPSECDGARDREDCSPTPVPSPKPSPIPSSKPSIEASVGPSATPSETPTSCSHLIDECPTGCWEIDPNDRPASCASIGNTMCNVLPLPVGIDCGCCPDKCLDPQDRIDCSPTPLPSPVPSSKPTDLPSLLPSPAPSSMPSECTYLIDECPALCFEADPMKRHPQCADFDRPDCDVLPYDEADCPQCCPLECNGARDREDCSPTPVPSPMPSSKPSIEASVGPSDTPSEAPTSCSHLIDECPTACWETNPNDRPASCSSIGNNMCNVLPLPIGIKCGCCPDKCLDPQDRIDCSPTPLPSVGPSYVPSPEPSSTPSLDPTLEQSSYPSTVPSSSPTRVPSRDPSSPPSDAPSMKPSETQSASPSDAPSKAPTESPSAMPTSCNHLIDECPVACWEANPNDRLASCVSVGRTICRNIPLPSGISCDCCPDECLNPQDRVECSPTPLPSPKPSGKPTLPGVIVLETLKPSNDPSMVPSSKPSIEASVGPSATPSETPTSCSHLIDECPTGCWEIDPNDRPASCASIGNTMCNVLPLPVGIDCGCCPDKCLDPQDRIDCSPTPLPSPIPSPGPTALPSSVPSSKPTDLPSLLPSPAPSSMPSECTYLIDECPALCFEADPMKRHPQCADFDRPDCDVLPYDEADCPQCCPLECNGARDREDCSPTPVPSPMPSSKPSIEASVGPSDTPSEAPTSCSHLIDECPTACWETNPNDRPASCSSIGNNMCNVLPLPIGIKCGCCPDKCLDPQDRIDCSPTPLPSPIPSPVPTPLPSPGPSSLPSSSDLGVIMDTQQPSESPSSAPSMSPSTVPSAGLSTVPSGLPSIIPTFLPFLAEAEGCGLDISVDESCMVACSFDLCVERPYRMQMLYTGGGCEGTSFKRCAGEDSDACTCTKEDVPCFQWNQNNSCKDFDAEGNICNNLQQTCEGGATAGLASECGPPPSNENHKVYIEAFGREESYFAGPVNVNATWEAMTTTDAVDDYTDIFTYDWDENSGKGRLMQHVVFDSSCKEDLVLSDQFGCHQLREMDSYCQPSCNDGGCMDVTENGLTFGRRSISLLMETDAQLRLDKLIGSIARAGTDNNVQLEHVLGLYTPVDFSAPGTLLNFSEAIGQVVPPPVELSQSGLVISAKTNYSVATIVTGFLLGDRGSPCQQIAESQIGCRRVQELPCQCPPCVASQLSSLPPVGISPPSSDPPPTGGPPPTGVPPIPSAPPPTPNPPSLGAPSPTGTPSSPLVPIPAPTRVPAGKADKSKGGKSGTSNSSKGKQDGKADKFGKSWMSDPGKSGKGVFGKSKSTKGDSGKAGKADKSDSGKSVSGKGKSSKGDSGKTGKADKSDSGKSGKSVSGKSKSTKGDSGKAGKADKSDSGKSVSGKSKSTKEDSGKAGKADKSDSGKSVSGKGKSSKGDSGKAGKADKSDSGKSGKSVSGKSKSTKGDSGKAGKSDNSGKAGKSDSGKAGKSDDDVGDQSGKAGKNDSSKSGKSASGKSKSTKGDLGKAGKNNDAIGDQSGKAGKIDDGVSDQSGKDDSGKSGKSSSGKSKSTKGDTGKAGKSDGTVGDQSGKAGKNDSGKAGKSDWTIGDQSGKSWMSNPGKAGKSDDGIGDQSGKAAKSNSGKIGKSNSGKSKSTKGDSGKAGKNDDAIGDQSGKTGKSGKSGKSDDATGDQSGMASKSNSGKSGKSASGKSKSTKGDPGKAGKNNDAISHQSGKTGKSDSDKSGKDDSGKNNSGSTGKSGSGKNGKIDSANDSTGKPDSSTGKWAGKTGKNDSGKIDQSSPSGKVDSGNKGSSSKGKVSSASPPTAISVAFETSNPSPTNIANLIPVVSSPSLAPDTDASIFSTLLPTAGVQLMAAQPVCDLDLVFLDQCTFECRHEVCKETPYRMQMKYNGGGCYGMSFKRCLGDNPDYCSCDKEELPCSEWSTGNVCADFTSDGRVCNSHGVTCAEQNNKNPTPGCGPPASTEAHTVYIEAYGENELYFSGPVSVNSTWEATTEGEKMSTNTAIFTYEWIEGIGKGKILQQILFQSSCSDDMSAGDQFGSQQLVEFDSFCDISCSDGGCKEVTELGHTFGRRRVSMYLEDVSSIRLDLGAGSFHSNVELEHVLAMYTPSDFSAPSQVFNFSDAIGATVPSTKRLDAKGLELSPGKEYSIAAIVTGFLNGDKSQLCSQVALSQLNCDKKATLQCSCPPCMGANVADLFDYDVSTEGENPLPTSPSKAPSKSPPTSFNPASKSNKGSGKNNGIPVADPSPPSKSPSKSPPSGKLPKETGKQDAPKDTKKMNAITRSDGK
ncbi:unnamed protein product [Cylindrotheca closterium]|uniref:DUF7467 domain-containing protein n=1 Tax=Cylindrotheca closterium TaxID=2856 RepID=A0AAD2CBV2_9STRA|nr:unnamed protein product [Cylindrotheca closterium]